MFSKNFLLDGISAFGLICALGIVYAFDSDSTPAPAKIPKVTEKEVDVPVIPKIKIAVTVSDQDFDDMGKLLHSLGEGYSYQKIDMDTLLDSQRLKEFDVIFFTCGVYPANWLEGNLGEGGRGTFKARAKPEVFDKAQANLRNYVQQGGTLYASDWRFGITAETFLDYINLLPVDEGDKQIVHAQVTNESLREIIGDQIELNFDKPGWRPAAFRGPSVVNYIEGEYRQTDGRKTHSPLLVKFPCGKGTVIFTSFHNEALNSKLETDLLKYLVFTAITAKTENIVTERMVQGGFSPSSKSLLNASSGAQSIERTYQCKKAGSLKFLLAFQDQGARLRLTVTSPDGKQYEDSETSTFSIDIDDAKVGSWSYAVIAEKIPYENFPFNLVIGEK